MKNATRIVATTFGLLAGLGGLEHGIGEMLQGNRAPTGIMIASWPEAEAMRILGGEPAMTLVPNLLVSGVLTILVALAILVWSIAFLPRKPGGLILLLLSVLLLLVGGGFGPPLFGLIAWLAVLPGVPIIGYFFPLVDPGVIYTLILLAFGSLLATIVIGFVHDSYQQGGLYQAPTLSG